MQRNQKTNPRVRDRRRRKLRHARQLESRMKNEYDEYYLPHVQVYYFFFKSYRFLIENLLLELKSLLLRYLWHTSPCRKPV